MIKTQRMNEARMRTFLERAPPDAGLISARRFADPVAPAPTVRRAAVRYPGSGEAMPSTLVCVQETPRRATDCHTGADRLPRHGIGEARSGRR